jgi:hypothetical protein
VGLPYPYTTEPAHQPSLGDSQSVRKNLSGQGAGRGRGRPPYNSPQ